jgi:hypothetical protein
MVKAVICYLDSMIGVLTVRPTISATGITAPLLFWELTTSFRSIVIPRKSGPEHLFGDREVLFSECL